MYDNALNTEVMHYKERLAIVGRIYNRAQYDIQRPKWPRLGNARLQIAGSKAWGLVRLKAGRFTTFFITPLYATLLLRVVVKDAWLVSNYTHL